jgi:hypothetical protein
MESREAINTELGLLCGRDCIFLDEVKVENSGGTLVLIGDINGHLCEEKSTDDYLGYTMRFHGVLALRMIELDSSYGVASKSSFDVVHSSEWASTLGGKVASQHRHYCVATYDYVFDIICDSCDLNIKRGSWAQQGSRLG